MDSLLADTIAALRRADAEAEAADQTSSSSMGPPSARSPSTDPPNASEEGRSRPPVAETPGRPGKWKGGGKWHCKCGASHERVFPLRMAGCPNATDGNPALSLILPTSIPIFPIGRAIADRFARLDALLGETPPPPVYETPPGGDARDLGDLGVDDLGGGNHGPRLHFPATLVAAVEAQRARFGRYMRMEGGGLGSATLTRDSASICASIGDALLGEAVAGVAAELGAFSDALCVDIFEKEFA